MRRNWSLVLCSLLGFAIALGFAFLRPGYFSNPTLLGAMVFLQFLAVILLKYRQTFFAALIVFFLLAGMEVPDHEVWTSARWLVLAVGAVAGLMLWLKSNNRSIRIFHLAALGCVLTAIVSALVSAYPEVALLKATSLSLLFLYSATGIRVAVSGKEDEFFSALLLGCEVVVYVSAVAYFALHVELFGNRNSLGVVAGVVAFPILLWGLLISEPGPVRRRRTLAMLLCLALLLSSYERAGIVAALVSSTLLCVGLRRYRFFFGGIAVALVTALLVMAFVPLPVTDPSDDSSLTSRFVYKGKRESGVLASRKTVWEKTLSSLREHPWFGTGFGTSATSYDKSEVSATFSSAAQITREHGNSYLEIAEWVGLIGLLPFATLLFLVAVNVARVYVWMRRYSVKFSPAVPLAAFVAGALVHAGFEDWLFAVGYHTCVLFWAFAFLLSDFVPSKATARLRYFDERLPSPIPRGSFAARTA